MLAVHLLILKPMFIVYNRIHYILSCIVIYVNETLSVQSQNAAQVPNMADSVTCTNWTAVSHHCLIAALGGIHLKDLSL